MPAASRTSLSPKAKKNAKAKGSASPKNTKYKVDGEQKKELSSEQREDIKVAFDLFDKDDSGYITREEFSDAMRALGFDGDREEVMAIMAAGDDSKDEHGGGELDFPEFLRLMTDKLMNHDVADDIERCFKIFAGKDHTRTQYIDASDLKRTAKEMGDTYTDAQWDALMDSVSHGRGVLEVDDWMRIMKNQNLY